MERHPQTAFRKAPKQYGQAVKKLDQGPINDMQQDYLLSFCEQSNTDEGTTFPSIIFASIYLDPYKDKEEVRASTSHKSQHEAKISYEQPPTTLKTKT